MLVQGHKNSELPVKLSKSSQTPTAYSRFYHKLEMQRRVRLVSVTAQTSKGPRRGSYRATIRSSDNNGVATITSAKAPALYEFSPMGESQYERNH